MSSSIQNHTYPFYVCLSEFMWVNQRHTNPQSLKAKAHKSLEIKQKHIYPILFFKLQEN